MMSKQQYIWWTGLILLWLVKASAWWLWLRPVVRGWLNNSSLPADNWWQQALLTLYPRLVTELPRLGSDFLISRADGVLVRLLLLLVAAFLGQKYLIPWLFNQHRSEESAATLPRWLHLTTIAFLGWFLFDIYDDLLRREPIAFVFEGRWPWNTLSLLASAPTTKWLEVNIGLSVAACLLSLFRPMHVLTRRLLFAQFLVLQYWLYGYGKLDHTYATMNWALLAWAWQSTLTLRLAVVATGMTYSLAGLEKLLASGFLWVIDAREYLILEHSPLGSALAGLPWLSALLFLLALLFQVFSLPWLLSRWRLWVWMTTAVVFHLVTFLLFGAGAWISPWYLALIYCWHWHGKASTRPLI